MRKTGLQVFKLANRGYYVDVRFIAVMLGNTARLSSVHFVHIPTKVLSWKQEHGIISHTHYPHYATVRHQNVSTANFRHCQPDDTVSRRVSLTALFRTAGMRVYVEGWIWAKVRSYLEAVTVKYIKMYETVVLLT
jgi:hypothetical protein